ncbi:MAG: formate/nitrite transporter family protein [Ruminococcus sp.]|nr:formate/nitrite transporter family protein [Ruminococcus sp.]
MSNDKLKVNKWLSYIIDGILSGITLGVGGMVSFSSDNRYVGAFLFALGLFTIVQFRYGLFTGKVGYIVNREPAYILEVLVTLASNAVGTFISAILLRQTRFFTTVVSGMEQTIEERVTAAVDGKIHDDPLSIFVLALFCGMLMFTAVEVNRQCRAKGNFVGALFGVVFPVVVFIICGFNHCIADMFYYFFCGCPDVPAAILYFALAILGNAAGGMLIPAMKKLSNLPLED